MNVIFLDFDGVIDTCYYTSAQDMENKIRILGDICKEYDCKVVIEASAKDAIDEETLETESEWIKNIFKWFKKYGIECIGRTPTVQKKISENSSYPIWKEYEIIAYLRKHPEIEHFCVIDDDDLAPHNSDLNLVRDHLVETLYYSENGEEEGLQEHHKEEVGKALQKVNEFKVRR